jgi:hypothetical protein
MPSPPKGGGPLASLIVMILLLPRLNLTPRQQDFLFYIKDATDCCNAQ